MLPYWEGFYPIIGEVLPECRVSTIGLEKPVATGNSSSNFHNNNFDQSRENLEKKNTWFFLRGGSFKLFEGKNGKIMNFNWCLSRIFNTFCATRLGMHATKLGMHATRLSLPEWK